MSNRTVTNEVYKGLVEAMAIPAQLHARASGGHYASFGGALPIHCATKEQVEQLAETTHHYCDIFTDQVLAPLGELVYVRLDDSTAEKVFINRAKRILLVSSDGRLAQWRAAPSFESANHFVAGAPVVDKDGALVSLVTARKGNHYAVSTFEGEGGYFESPLPWTTLDTPEGHLVYGSHSFATRDELRAFVTSLGPAELSETAPARPVVQVTGANTARLALQTDQGRQIAHIMLQNVVTGAEYL